MVEWRLKICDDDMLTTFQTTKREYSLKLDSPIPKGWGLWGEPVQKLSGNSIMEKCEKGMQKMWAQHINRECKYCDPKT